VRHGRTTTWLLVVGLLSVFASLTATAFGLSPLALAPRVAAVAPPALSYTWHAVLNDVPCGVAESSGF
jgi:hypothetical protein